jgi:type VI secretion system protein VasG
LLRLIWLKSKTGLKKHYGAVFSYDEDSLLQIVARCQEADTGARNIENILNKTILPQLASECLQKLAQELPVNSIHINTNDEGEFSYLIN